MNPEPVPSGVTICTTPGETSLTMDETAGGPQASPNRSTAAVTSAWATGFPWDFGFTNRQRLENSRSSLGIDGFSVPLEYSNYPAFMLGSDETIRMARRIITG